MLNTAMLLTILVLMPIATGDIDANEVVLVGAIFDVVAQVGHIATFDLVAGVHMCTSLIW